MTNDKKPDSPKKRTRQDPVSLYPLDFEEALRGILEAGPHVEPEDEEQKQKQKQKAQDATQRGKKDEDS